MRVLGLSLPKWAFCVVVFSAASWAQPYVNYRGAVNVASYMAPGLPAGSLPRGGMIAIFGRNLGPSSGVLANAFPLGNALSGVSVTLTQQTTSVNVLPIYVSAGQINAIVPSNAPLGRGSIRVTVNGVASNPSPVNVVAASFGIITANGAGFGPAIVQNYTGTGVDPVNSPLHPAKPNQVEILWGTGLGAVPQDNVAPTPGNLPVSVEVLVGGKSANVQYSGRSSCCAGIDQINFTVPPNAPTGCYVPIVVRLNGSIVSNTATMAIDPGGVSCSDPANALSSIFRSGGRFGAALLNHEEVVTTVAGLSQSFTADRAMLTLRQEAGGEWAFHPYVSLPPLGTCTAYAILGQFPMLDDLPGVAASVKDLGGGAISVNSAAGNVTLPPALGPPAVYTGLLATSKNLLNVLTSYFVPGAASTISGTAGAEVGAFQASLTAASAPAWTNSASAASITRANGLTVTWANAPSSANVISITGFNVDQANNATGGFHCMANPSDGSFTVPAAALANVPVTPASAAFATGMITVGAAQLASPGSFTATGLDRGVAVFGSSSGRTVVFK